MNQNLSLYGFVCRIFVCTIVLSNSIAVMAQAIITFSSASLFSGTDYYEQGMWFHTVIPPGEHPHDGMAGSPAILGPSNIPYNNTPYILFFRQNSPGDYVTLSLTNGFSFGIASVSLADPTSPSPSAVPITFKGHKADGSTVSDTFTTPGAGANSFLNYQFSSEFSSGLTSVEINSTRWAMDNLVVVPEPGITSLLVVGMMACGGLSAYKRRHNRRVAAK